MTTQSGAQQGPPAITVVIPAYGVADMLGDALGSLLAQDRGDWEAIVVDDGDARVAEHIRPWLSDPRIRLLQTDNRGLPTARNRAIAASRAPYVALLDGDDMFESDYVSSMLAAIEASPRTGFVSSDATFFGIDRQGERFSTYCPQEPPASLDRVLRRAFNVFVAVTMRRAAIEGIGGFDASLRSSEDLDAWIRLIEAGWELAYVPRPLARYRRRAGQMSGNTPVMLQSTLGVIDAARHRLAGRPEAAAAAETCAKLRNEIDIEDAFGRIAAGDARTGVGMLVRAGMGGRNLRWRVALAAMRIIPSLARPLLKARARIQPVQISPRKLQHHDIITCTTPNRRRITPMTINTGDRVPAANFTRMTADGPAPITSEALFAGRTVAMFSVPGAFTPTCSAKHLPGFIERAAELTAKGVDEIVCTAVNDVFVMDAWGKSAGAAGKVSMLADGNGDFVRALGLEFDGTRFGMGHRGQRFSMLVRDGVIAVLNVEAPGEYNVSSADHMLGQL